MATIIDVAKRAGVSPMSVSRAINNKRGISDETRAKIFEAIKELNYYPNIMGQGLTGSKISIIGFMTPIGTEIITENPYYSGLLVGIEKACIKNRFDMLISTSKPGEKEFDYIGLFYQRKIDGMIIAAPNVKDQQITEIGEKNIPCVIIGERPDKQKISYVDTDNKKGGFMAVEHLVKNGHRKIGFLKGLMRTKNASDRIDGFMDGMEHFGIPVNKSWIYEGDLSFESGTKALDNLLSAGDLPTALICTNDVMAIALFLRAKERGIDIPGQLSIIGFDGIPQAKFMQPPLTTFRQPLNEMGHAAAEILFRKVNKLDQPQEMQIYPLELVEGGTVKNINK
jgi:LacI family transcriptional regulator